VGEGNAYIERTFEPRRTPLAAELARFGLQTEDVSLLVNSHLHFDHCGNNRLFPHAETFVQANELSVARTSRYTVTEWFDYEGARITPVSEDTEISPGVTLIQSPGHTPGHQSVLVETAGGRTLVAAQAAYTADEYRRGGDPSEQAHEGLNEQYVQSISRLKSLAAQRVYFSHDTAQWPISE
jgi:glyoxylase-like metal-dependent hydrolase (beta-lactamase superfamily II)